jgi:peptidoglycan hydrolase CwlO-like protein
MTDPAIHEEISRLVAAEHELRSRVASGAADVEESRQELAQLEQSLDQCWDLLRQRAALREFGQDPDAAAVRDVGTVEGYRQ